MKGRGGTRAATEPEKGCFGGREGTTRVHIGECSFRRLVFTRARGKSGWDGGSK